MAFCPRCNSKLPERARFCLQCGAHVSEDAASFDRDGAPSRPKQQRRAPELDSGGFEPLEEPRRISASKSEVLCRFCHGPLDLEGDFCEQCGAPVAEAAPPGMVKPKPAPSVEPAPPSKPPPPITGEASSGSEEAWHGVSIAPSTGTPPASAESPKFRIGSGGDQNAPTVKMSAWLSTPPATRPPAPRPPSPSAGTPLGPPSHPDQPVGPEAPTAAPPQAPRSSGPLQHKQPAQPHVTWGSIAPTPRARGGHLPAVTMSGNNRKPPVSTFPAAHPSALTLEGDGARSSSVEAWVATAKSLARNTTALVTGSAAIAVMIGIVGLFHRHATPPPEKPPAQVTASSPETQPAPAPSSTERRTTTEPAAALPEPTAAAEPQEQVIPTKAEVSARPTRKARARKAAPAAAEVSRPAVRKPLAEIAHLEELARNAYTKGNYADPPDASAISYAKRVLALDPSNKFSKIIIDNSVIGGKYKVQQALKSKDFASARRIANALAQLLPGRSDVNSLRQQISAAERATTPQRHGEAPAAVSFFAYHLHRDKSPADHGPYCLGILSVATDHLRFHGTRASDGEEAHSFDIACSDIRDIKRNLRVASHEAGFHVRASGQKINFVPQDFSAAHVWSLAAACSK